MMSQGPRPESTDSDWKGLYRIGGAAVLIAVLIFRRNLGAEVSLLSDIAVPETAVNWFALLQSHTLLGLVYLEIFDIINYALMGLVFLALYGALRRANKSAMVIATASCLVGVALQFASNQAFSMLALSGQHAAATTDAQRSMFLAAGEALLAVSNPGAVYQGAGVYLSLLLVLAGGLTISIVMLRTSIFGKATACVGILANAFGLGYFIVLALAPAILALPSVVSAPFRLIWYVLIARGLFRLGRLEGKTFSGQMR